MIEHVTGLTLLVNHYLGRFALALLTALHIKPENPELPIPEHVVMAFVVLVIGTLLALFLRSRLSVEKPGASQQVAELLLTNPLGFGIKDLLEENVHHGAVKLLPFVGTISVFVLLSNLLSVFPVFAAPTANKTVPLACATLTFLYFNWQGIKHHGVVGYLLTFAGAPKKLGDWLLAILLFPVEIVSTSARVLSLTVRLWANILASDLLYSIFLSLFSMATVAAWSKSPVFGIVVAVLPATIPIAFIGLHIFVAIIQAYIFTVLPSVYLGMATADEH
ncbi:MAG TPA: FoF1 ATP synthase subunit a [Candidatus Acidoferrum sp.]|nr:FoF1 ATP synthase subunit a [Candidatus Acidoferrum sp.]